MAKLQTCITRVKSGSLNAGDKFVCYYGSGSDAPIESFQVTLTGSMSADAAANAALFANSFNAVNSGSPVINGRPAVAAAVGDLLIISYVTLHATPDVSLQQPRLLDIVTRTAGLLSDIGVVGTTDVVINPVLTNQAALALVKAGVKVGVAVVS